MENLKSVAFLMGIAGLFFGTWPLLMNRSGLSGLAPATIFSGTIFVAVVSLALFKGITFAGADWKFTLGAGVFATCAVLTFTFGIMQVPPRVIGKMTAIMIIVQICVPCLYTLAMNGWHLPLRTSAGFVAAFVAAVLLTG